MNTNAGMYLFNFNNENDRIKNQAKKEPKRTERSKK